MKALIQRVSEASVRVDGTCIAHIDAGLLALIGVERDDTLADADKLLSRLLTYRIFADEAGKMNLGLADHGGGLLLVSQFTLVADTRKGRRPGFSAAASPEHGKSCFDYLVEQAREQHDPVATGQFGADMKVALINDGPVTFWLSS
ncbi:D-aminoacyl-tRNA deacylase [Larsenimonas suaedae]|uniref:D-aminoacyl-tRNA deacylase n=1 Tax=Larsenimonas suaedae TaxID=1851019 RepID=A0ABU1GYE2_9GAMM|nr:D-aminoacyl-tRNA deacylase [Larsenimonas suaedae]MCM2973563.1 D-aminoacyl-tRNA deacylase [Larsenimonas suaedae]MDR5897067.1 D-aminoacyl-tRNA deacylase [Larsenimonas suaedae]